MKAKQFKFEAYTITQAAKKLGYKSTKTIYRLLNRKVLENYVYLEKSGRVYLVFDPPNLPSLAEKISGNIQFKKSNVIKKGLRNSPKRSTINQ